MDRHRVVRTLEALVMLAFDQAGKPEGSNAYGKAIAWVAKHSVRMSELSPLCQQHANHLHLVFAPESSRSQYTDYRSQYRSSYAPPPPPRPKRDVRTYRTDRPYRDGGVCEECGKEYIRGKEHSGMHARYCSPDCFEAQRRRKAKERMQAARQRARNAQ